MLFLIVIYSPENQWTAHLNNKLKPKQSLCNKCSFSQFGTQNDDDIVVKLFKKHFLVLKHPIKNKSHWSAEKSAHFSGKASYKRQVKQVWHHLPMVILSTVIIITQSDTRDVEYLMKMNLEQLRFD